MHSILTSSDQVIRRVSIHYGCGKTATLEHVQSIHTWEAIEQLLNRPSQHNSIVIDYFEASTGKNHPLLNGQLLDDLDVEPGDNDRLHHVTLRPIPTTVLFNSTTTPRWIHMIANRLEMYVQRDRQHWSAAIVAMVALDLQTGSLAINREIVEM